MRHLRLALHSVLFSASARPLWRLVLLLLLVFISYMALSPAPPKSLGSSWDKLNHALAFASLAFCGHWSLSSGRARWIALPLALLAYGGAIELLQLNIPGRDGEWADLLGDAVGITIGLAAAVTLQRLAKRPS
ncbi:VanZ family protein [Roseateles albus]|uniref:VanZ family protein n=1 Tax=Roseateles albus TaxID=2987525 RepID=A0ABT5KIT3_9BURK|nr:VanZ family protein [Roseateles albus]MDC8773848.1 VanZ family protein [Roseateles albus]